MGTNWLVMTCDTSDLLITGKLSKSNWKASHSLDIFLKPCSRFTRSSPTQRPWTSPCLLPRQSSKRHNVIPITTVKCSCICALSWLWKHEYVSEECCAHKVIITWFPLQQKWVMECKMALEAAWGNLHQRWKTIDFVMAFELRSVFSPQRLSSVQYWIFSSLRVENSDPKPQPLPTLSSYFSDIKGSKIIDLLLGKKWLIGLRAIC